MWNFHISTQHETHEFIALLLFIVCKFYFSLLLHFSLALLFFQFIHITLLFIVYKSKINYNISTSSHFSIIPYFQLLMPLLNLLLVSYSYFKWWLKIALIYKFLLHFYELTNFSSIIIFYLVPFSYKMINQQLQQRYTFYSLHSLLENYHRDPALLKRTDLLCNKFIN